MSVRPIAWLHGNLGFGGGEKVLIEQIKALAPRGAPMDVLTVAASGPQDLVADVRAASPLVRDVHPVDGTTALSRILRRRRYEAVFTCWSLRAYRAVACLRWTPWVGRPVVIETAHERYDYAFLDHRQRRRRQVDFWVCMHDFRERVVAAFDVPLERVAVTRPLFASLLPTDTPRTREAGRRLRASLGIPAGALVVGYAGRLSGNKGLHHVIPMVARAAAGGLDVHLVVAGRRSLMTPEHGRALDEAIAAASAPGAALAGRLHLLGALPDVHPVYGASDVVVLLSHVEGLFPLMLVEAMGHGVPVVTTDVGGIGGCLADVRDAAVVEKIPDDARDPTPEVLTAFERRLHAVLCDPGERARLGDAGRRRVETLVGENDFHGDTRAAYDRALSLGRMRR